MDRIAPDKTAEKSPTQLYRHSAEGPDDMPSHVKSSLLGASLNVPIQNGKLALGYAFQSPVFRKSTVAREYITGSAQMTNRA